MPEFFRNLSFRFTKLDSFESRGWRCGEARLDHEITHEENYDLDRSTRFPDEEVH